MSAGATALTETFARFGVVFDSGPLVRGQTATNDATTALQTLGRVVVGSALVAGLRSFNNEMVAIGDELNATSNLLGVSSRELQEWHLAAELADVSASEFDGAVLRLQNRMAQGGTGAQVFRHLGVDIRDANGELRNASDVLTDLADPIAALSTDAERTGVLVDLLGRSGARMAPLFARGAAGIAEARAELEQLGGGASEEFIEAADRADNATHRLDVAWLALRSRIAVYVIPVFEAITVGLTRVSAGLARAAEHSRLLEAAFVVLGIAGAAAGSRTALAWIRAAAPFIALGALVLGLILIVDDLWVGFAGGESVLLDLGLAFEEWGESLSGEGGIFFAIAASIEYVKGLLISFVSTVWDMINAAGRLVGLGEEIAGNNALANLTDNIGQEDDPNAAAAQAISDRNRERFGAGEFLIPDSFERFMALDEARRSSATGASAATGAGGGAPQITQTVQVDVNATGMTPAQAASAVEAGVRTALSAQTDDTLDALAGGVR